MPAVDQIKEVTKQLDNVKGKLGEMSAPMRKTLGANLGNALGAVEALIVKMGDSGLTASIISVANAFEGFFNFLANNPVIVSTITFVGLLVLKLWALKSIVGFLAPAFVFLGRQIAIFRVGMALAGGVAGTFSVALLTIKTTLKGLFLANPFAWIYVAYEGLMALYKLWKKFKGEKEGDATKNGESQQSKQTAYWQGSDGKMTPYTPQSKQKITTDLNIHLGGNVPEGTKAEAVQRGTSGVDVGTTSILKGMFKSYGV